jgi:hypothetical protein
VLFDVEGSEGTGEPDDRGCETQSSDNESSQACSIVTQESDSQGKQNVFSAVAFHRSRFVIVPIVLLLW